MLWPCIVITVSNAMAGVDRAPGSTPRFADWRIQGSRPPILEVVTSQINTYAQGKARNKCILPVLPYSLSRPVFLVLPFNSDTSWRVAVFCHQSDSREDISGTSRFRRRTEAIFSPWRGFIWPGSFHRKELFHILKGCMVDYIFLNTVVCVCVCARVCMCLQYFVVSLLGLNAGAIALVLSASCYPPPKSYYYYSVFLSHQLLHNTHTHSVFH